jgi:dienelactone hydrolase
MRRLTLLLSLPALLVAAEPATTEMSLTTPDGYTLSGTLTVPAGRGKHPVVILAHQFRSDREGWAPLTGKLNARGIATLALDLRGHGRSTDQAGTTVAVSNDFLASAHLVSFDQIPSDLVQAASWVRKQKSINGRRLGLAGSSIGAFSTLLAAPKIKPETILVLSPAGMEAFGKDAREHMVSATTHAHAILMAYVSSGDKEANDNAEPLRPIYGSNIRTFEGNRHGFDFLDENSDTMAVFFAEYLLHPHTGRAAAKPQTPTATTPAEAAAPATVLAPPAATKP